MEKMDEQKVVKDVNGVEVGIGDAVAILTSGNFIYGHITEVLNEKKVKVIPDIGYNTTKPNFRLKKSYTVASDSIGIVNDPNQPADVIVDNNCTEIVL